MKLWVSEGSIGGDVPKIDDRENEALATLRRK